MACGAPVVTSRGGAIPEVVGEAALLANPGDASALRSAILRLLTDRRLREDLIARGHERAAQFSWDTSAKLMRDMFIDARGR